ncbi:MAG: tetratricopeptide repeat protein [Pirellulales bacterium]
MLLVQTTTSRAVDVVYLAPRSADREIVRKEGQVLDATGHSVRLLQANSLVQTFPTKRVLRIDGQWTAPHRRGNQAMNRGEFAAAINAYRQALDRESRPWARREILARLVACQSAIDDIPSAATTFFELLQSDPFTPHFSEIPLAWQADTAVPPGRAVRWLESLEKPVHVLLGASHLLASDHRAAAAKALERLVTLEDRRLAMLAEAELWRYQPRPVTVELIDTWQRRVQEIPTPLRAGPLLIVGRARADHQQWDQAALAFLQVAILHSHQPRLAAVATAAAAEMLMRMDQNEAAQRLLDECLQKFGETPSAARARELARRASE